MPFKCCLTLIHKKPKTINKVNSTSKFNQHAVDFKAHKIKKLIPERILKKKIIMSN